MKMKKFLFCLWHWTALPFCLFFLWFALRSSKKKYKRLEDENEVVSLTDCYDYVYSMASKAVFCAMTKVKIRGIKNIPANKPVLFVPNHKSNFDVLVFLKAFQNIKEKHGEILNPTFLSKVEILKTKRVSYAAKLINTIFIDRKNLRDLVRVNKEEKELLQKNEQSLVIFIEGTRIKKDELGEFKATALSPAYSTFCQIVPVMIYGTLGVERDYKKNIFKYKEVTVEFLESFKYKDFIHLSKELVAEKIKAKIDAAYSKTKADPFWKEEKDSQ